MDYAWTSKGGISGNFCTLETPDCTLVGPIIHLLVGHQYLLDKVAINIV
jgi:hypothetical protein